MNCSLARVSLTSIGAVGMQGWPVRVHPGQALVMFQTPAAFFLSIELYITMSGWVAGNALLVTYTIAYSCTFLDLEDYLISLVPGHGEHLLSTFPSLCPTSYLIKRKRQNES